MHEYDNRYLWMNLKRIIGSHFANYREAWEANRLVAKGLVHPTLSKSTRSKRRDRQHSRFSKPSPRQGRGTLLVTKRGLGVRDHEFRERHA